MKTEIQPNMISNNNTHWFNKIEQLDCEIEPVKKPSHVKCLAKVDTSAFIQQIAPFSDELWQRENASKENQYGCLQQTEHIIFRFIIDNQDPRHFYSRPLWSLTKHLLLPLMEQACVSYGFSCPCYPKIMLARLRAKGHIARHFDGEGSHPYTHKIHIPLLTSPEAKMTIAEQSFYLESGTAYEVNNLLEHSVENKSASPRLHLIFEVFDQGKCAKNKHPVS